MTRAETQKTGKDGFTIIELSIVLVIIGLLIGGIMTAKSLIHAAEIRSLLSQKQRFDIALTSFVLQNNRLPGDTDGDGILGSGRGNTSDEVKQFWKDLYTAGFLNDPAAGSNPSPGTTTIWYGLGPSIAGVQSPGCSICKTYPMTYGGVTVSAGGWGFEQMARDYGSLDCSNLGHWTAAGGALPPADGFAWLLSDANITLWGGGGSGGTISPSDASSIDAKIDDGSPLTGKVLGLDSYTYSDAACSGNSSYPSLYVKDWAGSCAHGTAYAITGQSTYCNMLLVTTTPALTPHGF